MRRSALVPLGVAMVCLAAIIAPLVGAASEYNVTTDQSIDVPDRTVEQNGDTFTITSISRADPGDTISVTVDAPQGTEATLYLYNNDQEIVKTIGREPGTTTYDVTLTDGQGNDLASGTYALLVQHDGSREAAHPLVIRGYSVSVNDPADVTKGETLSVSADISKLRGQDQQRVEIVVANDDTTIRETASSTGSGTFTASIDTDDLNAGRYDVYANVRGSEEALGEEELLGLSDSRTVEIEEPETTSAPGGGGGAGGATSTPSSGTATPGGTSTPASTPNQQSQSAIAESVTKEIVDENSQKQGVNVQVDTETLREITFNDESVQVAGEITVQRRSSPPSAISQQFGSDNVVTSVSIDVPPAATESQATLRFELSQATASEVSPDRLGVVRMVDGGLQLLPTDVETTSNGLVVTAETPGFSEFAVVQLEQSTTGDTTETSTQTDDGAITPNTQTTGSETNTTTSGNGSTHLGTILVLAMLAVIAGAHWRRE